MSQAKVSDYGTKERARQGMGVRIQARDVTDEHGRIKQTLGAVARDTGLCDVLYERGRLESASDRDNEAYRRWSAACWYRQLYDKLHTSAQYPAYDGGLPSGEGEMSDAQAWNWRCWIETRRDMGLHDKVLYAACIDDTLRGYSDEALRRALEALADWRGL